MPSELSLALFVDLAQLIVLVIGLAYGVKKLQKIEEANRLTYAIQKANHDWQKRKAAKDALSTRSSISISNLNRELNYINASEPISVSSCFDAFERYEGLQMELHQLLNFYEGLCHGIKQGVFDEEVIRTSVGRLMSKSFYRFKPYIDERRNTLNAATAWADFESFVRKWEHDRNLVTHREDPLALSIRDTVTGLPKK